MATSHKAKVDCISVEYVYPSQMTALWRATAQCGKYVDVVVSSDVPIEVIPYIVNRIIPDPNDYEYQEILGKLDVKPNNVQRFLLSAIQEMMDALNENVRMDCIRVVYQENSLDFIWEFTNLDNGAGAVIHFTETPGKEITMEQFLKENQILASREVDLSKRDIRKMFVIIKKIVKLFPRVSTKNTPLRGLYMSY